MFKISVRSVSSLTFTAPLADENFPSRILFMLAGNAIGLYYLLQLTLELSLAAASAYASYRYGASAPELLSAIRQLAAGPMSGLNLADKASNIVNMVRVLQALEEVAMLMQVRAGVLAPEGFNRQRFILWRYHCSAIRLDGHRPNSVTLLRHPREMRRIR